MSPWDSDARCWAHRPSCLSLCTEQEETRCLWWYQCQETRGVVMADVPTDPERGRRNYWNKWILKSISQMHKCSPATPSCFRDAAGGIYCNYCRPHTDAHMRNVRANEEYRCSCHTRAKSSSHKDWESIARISPHNTKKCASERLTPPIYQVQIQFGLTTNQSVIFTLGTRFQSLKIIYSANTEWSRLETKQGICSRHNWHS